MGTPLILKNTLNVNARMGLKALCAPGKEINITISL